MKQAGKPSAGKPHAGFDVAGTGNQLTAQLVRHSQRKRGVTDRLSLRSMRRQSSTLLIERVVSRTRREARCCTKDEGGSFGVALWEEASNCRKLRRPKAAVVNVPVKRRD